MSEENENSQLNQGSSENTKMDEKTLDNKTNSCDAINEDDTEDSLNLELEDTEKVLDDLKVTSNEEDESLKLVLEETEEIQHEKTKETEDKISENKDSEDEDDDLKLILDDSGSLNNSNNDQTLNDGEKDDDLNTKLDLNDSLSIDENDDLKIEEAPIKENPKITPRESKDEIEEFLNSSQNVLNNKTVAKHKTPVLSKNMETWSSRFKDSRLKDLLKCQPVLGKGLGGKELIIDDENTRKKKENFKDRFVNQFIKAPKESIPNEESVDLTIVKRNVDNEGKESFTTEKLHYHSNMMDFRKIKSKFLEEKPGQKQLLLKQTLKEKISAAKRQAKQQRDELKKLEENEESILDDETEFVDEFDDIEDEEEMEEEDNYLNENEDDEMADDEEEEDNDNDNEGSEDELEENEKPQTKRIVKNPFIEEEADDEDDDEVGTLALEDDSETEMDTFKQTDDLKSPSKEVQPTLTPLSQLVDEPRWTPYDERQKDSDNLNNHSSQARKRLGFDGLVDQTDPQVDDMDDIIGLCSGQFKTQNFDLLDQLTQYPKETPDTLIITPSVENETQDTVLLSNNDESQISKNQTLSQSAKVNDLESSDDEEDNFAAKNNKKSKMSRILSDDESDNESQNEEESNKKDSMNSEDEDDNKDQVDNNESETENNAEVMYDSDENEIIVKNKFKGFKGKKGIRREFVENEAELSGSEGSDDEDERGLNKFELEEGDLDDLDEDEIADELGKIHQKKILDQDKRDIRLFKEVFLEDGELYSDKSRARQFKWQGIDDVEENERRESDNDEDDAQAEREEKERLERLKRDKWIQESRKAKAIEEDNSDSQFFNMGNKALKKIEKKEVLRQTSLEEIIKSKSKNSFKAPVSKTPLQSIACNQRGSFLSRCSKTLDKLAAITKGRDEVRTGTGAKNSSNFVFASIDRQSEEKSKESSTTVTKKRKNNINVETSKRQKFDRTLDENSMDTIFGFM